MIETLTESVRQKLRNWLLTEDERGAMTLLDHLESRIVDLEAEEHPFDQALEKSTTVDEFAGDPDIVIVHGSHSNINAECDQFGSLIVRNMSHASVRGFGDQ